ncbi:MULTISPECIES: 16S rRNA (cytosine(1402)-N(4))-methyltransferase RsmH [Flectobacillus]|jgi:16S rRNA (cytosine1402-N4)-methyltransferase|uniref:Ribosomal RNA small subunit methyltransferase H n=1 Tax=Flectobacillus roseus TaxID=502259 RepID=A0ABT6YB14_9BACT|nr:MULTISPECIES: 16S rRNA (cytosine(1402)-N(4))-methyltransferase RsmH [Flectobacillus]MDI9860776.1 16S rRNA (cytosine(1402)-N(4))-methyltransferase RsmH [Flectobacillus roseus]MDI9869136.1 16S rRNA (cytosine(1402)-N(4))-methyltransferase RsmH [Flectobacillus roseus]NBA77830.1 16S rRNA (cytosine(1402)-N(4))-methyltransferase RsmH [Emticicia sp. ODNR4P]PAC29870.1 16S rRNA (cytosine(1402)-N(4))-methyltransferase [Flectobacillus sp. BAB-3569]
MYHESVMLHECVEGLNIRPDGVYVDVTFGGGGHSKAILEKLGEKGKLYAFDQDPDAKKNANLIDDKRLVFIEANFRYIKKYLRLHGVKQVDGILADFGISSHQIDEPTRGFSTRFDGELDMRMNQKAEVSAYTVINKYPEEQLHKIFGMYGEIKNARTLAGAICSERMNQPINTTGELKAILEKYAPKFKEFRYFAQVFQAIRIEVNQELDVIQEFLEQTPELLRDTDSRLCIMTFHSLEDRLVKNYIKSGNFYGELQKDIVYGTVDKPLEAVSRKPIEASADELARNNRSRSAKLRIATLSK